MVDILISLFVRSSFHSLPPKQCKSSSLEGEGKCDSAAAALSNLKTDHDSPSLPSSPAPTPFSCCILNAVIKLPPSLPPPLLPVAPSLPAAAPLWKWPWAEGDFPRDITQDLGQRERERETHSRALAGERVFLRTEYILFIPVLSLRTLQSQDRSKMDLKFYRIISTLLNL